MAKLKDTLVSGSLRATDTIYTTTVQAQIIQALISSDGTTYGPGSNGQVLKSNGTSVYWGTDNNTWRGIQDNLTSSTNTTESLSAKQGYLLANGSARDNTKLPLSGGTMTGTLALKGSSTSIEFKDASGVTKDSYSSNRDYNIAFITEKHLEDDNLDWFYLPTPAATGSHNTYYILTTKSPVTIAQGGTGATTADGACANIGAVKKSGDTMTGTLVVNRTSNGGEADIEAKSTAGSIYLYSAGSNTGNRGIYTTNANGTGKGVITIDQNNNITFDGNAATANAVSWTNVTNKAIDLTLSSSLDADAVRTTNGIWICSNAITNAPTVNHGALFGIASVGTPCQYFMPDNSYYTYKRYYSSSAWTNWTKIYAGYADSSGSCTGNAATATKATQDSDGNTISSTYLKLSGGTMTGNLHVDRTSAGAEANFGAISAAGAIYLYSRGSSTGSKGIWTVNAAGTGKNALLVDSNNDVTLYGHATSDLPLTGGTLTGALGFANNTWNPVGDDVYIGDCNMGGCLGIKGQNGATGLMFYSQDGQTTAKMYFDGTNFVSTNPITLLYNNSTKLRLFADNEGGNIVITSPDGHEYQFDAYNGDHLRLFSFDDGGNYHNLTWYRADGRLYVDRLNVGDPVSTCENLGAVKKSGDIMSGWLTAPTLRVKGTTYQFYLMANENETETGHVRAEIGDANSNHRIVFRAWNGNGDKYEDYYLPIAAVNTNAAYDILTTKYSATNPVQVREGLTHIYYRSATSDIASPSVGDICLVPV